MAMIPMQYEGGVRVVQLNIQSKTLSAAGEGIIGNISSYIPSGFHPIAIYIGNYSAFGSHAITPVLYNDASLFIIGSPNQAITNILIKIVCVRDTVTNLLVVNV